MSEPTAELLKKLGGYTLQARGKREVKVQDYLLHVRNQCPLTSLLLRGREL